MLSLFPNWDFLEKLWWVDLGWLPVLHQTVPSFPFLSRTREENRTKKFVGWDKDSGVIHQYHHGQNRLYLEKFSITYHQLITNKGSEKSALVVAFGGGGKWFKPLLSLGQTDNSSSRFGGVGVVCTDAGEYMHRHNLTFASLMLTDKE